MAGRNHPVDDNKYGPRADIKDVHQDRKVKGDNQRMTLAEKLMLAATLWGTEASNCFIQLYNMPLLQTLGMPLSLVSLTGLISGLPTLLLMPSLGWFMDRGSNPWRRKTIALVFTFGLLVCGLLCILVANILHLNGLLQQSSTGDVLATSSVFQNGSVSLCTTAQLPFHDSSNALLGGTGFENKTVMFKNLTDPSAEEYINGKSTTQSLSVPFKAGLGMLGCVLLDMGIDSSNACARAFVLASSPRSEHTSLLTIGLMMASAGGVSTAALGLVDFASILGLSDLDGGHLPIQTSMQAAAVIMFILLNLCVTLLSSRKQVARTHQLHKNDYIVAGTNQSEGLSAGTLENSIRYHCGKDLISIDQPALSAPKRPQSTLAQSDEDDLSSERTPLLLKREAMVLRSEELNQSCIIPVPALQHDNLGKGIDSYQHKANSLEKGTSEDLTFNVAVENKEQRGSCRLGVKAKIAFVCLSIYFSIGQINLHALTISDYVGKVIYGGDPAAPPESESLARYQASISVTSCGFLIYFGSYLLISMVHTRLLAFLGIRVDFVSAQLLMAGSAMILALTARLEAFFAMAVIAGFHRACLFAVPFIVVNDIVQDMAVSSGKSRVGLLMSAVTASIPLSYCTVFSWIGAAEEFTGNFALPLWVCTAFGCLSASSFLALGKV